MRRRFGRPRQNRNAIGLSRHIRNQPDRHPIQVAELQPAKQRIQIAGPQDQAGRRQRTIRRNRADLDGIIGQVRDRIGLFGQRIPPGGESPGAQGVVPIPVRLLEHRHQGRRGRFLRKRSGHSGEAGKTQRLGGEKQAMPVERTRRSRCLGLPQQRRGLHGRRLAKLVYQPDRQGHRRRGRQAPSQGRHPQQPAALRRRFQGAIQPCHLAAQIGPRRGRRRQQILQHLAAVQRAIRRHRPQSFHFGAAGRAIGEVLFHLPRFRRRKFAIHQANQHRLVGMCRPVTHDGPSSTAPWRAA